MKKDILILAILLVAGLNSSRSQNTWTQKADFGGSAREWAVGFSIGSKGYIGTGLSHSSNPVSFKDFWEYDLALNTWMQKADFGGTAREWAVGFSIGSKGYLGTGGYYDGTYHYYKDFWEYDPALNTWTQKADFGGTARGRAVGFSIGNKGYIGTGYGSTYMKDFWEYDPALNIWVQKADFSGTGRLDAVGFSIGSKGYLGTGYDNTYKKDFREYTPDVCNGWPVYADTDGDGYGDISNSNLASNCEVPSGFVIDISDCNDDNPLINPDATEIINGIDDNCNGIIDECLTPTNLSTKNITSTSVKFKWDTVAIATTYKLRYKAGSSGSWTLLAPTGHTKTVEGLSANTEYVWQIKSVCGVDPKITSDWSAKQHFTTSLRLAGEAIDDLSFSIYPNPAKDQTTIQFTLDESSCVNLKVYDVSGKEVAAVCDDDLQLGDHVFQLNTAAFSKGVYLVRMISDEGMENKKLIIQ